MDLSTDPGAVECSKHSCDYVTANRDFAKLRLRILATFLQHLVKKTSAHNTYDRYRVTRSRLEWYWGR
jgi:hypothetical protein